MGMNDEPSEEYKKRARDIIAYIHNSGFDDYAIADLLGDLFITTFHKAPPELKQYIGEVIECILVNTIAKQIPKDQRTLDKFTESHDNFYI